MIAIACDFFVHANIGGYMLAVNLSGKVFVNNLVNPTVALVKTPESSGYYCESINIEELKEKKYLRYEKIMK